MTDLQERFELFIRTVRAFESIDELLRDRHLEGKKRADYLLWDRQVIIEQKVLVDDPSDKPQKFIHQLIDKRQMLAYGTVSTNQVFGRMPDGEEQKKRMFLSITKGLEAEHDHFS